jgi:hypothetical protein
VLVEVWLPNEWVIGLGAGLADDPSLQVADPSGQRLTVSEQRKEQVEVVGHHAEGENVGRIAVS